MSGILSVTIGQMKRMRGVAYGVLKNGGYTTGIIVDGGTRYELLVAPVVGGQNGGLVGATIQWKTTNDAAPAATQTLTNGKAATDAMISAGTSTYPAAGFAQSARTSNLAGYNDWYIPARDELELCYRNLKPNTTANTVAARVTGVYGGDGLGIGTNSNSDPVGAAYTTSVPAMTTATTFQSGGSEAFVAINYWSSTEASATNAWRSFLQQRRPERQQQDDQPLLAVGTEICCVVSVHAVWTALRSSAVLHALPCFLQKKPILDLMTYKLE